MSALVDGQLDAAAAERAWAHVLACGTCRAEVEREGWVKTRLASMAGDEPPPRLVGSLYSLDSAAHDAWAAVAEIERQGRSRRRVGLALAGAGSLSVAVLGFASLGGATLGIGGAGTPAATLNGPQTPTANVHVAATGRPRPQDPSAQVPRNPQVTPPSLAGIAPAFTLYDHRPPLR